VHLEKTVGDLCPRCEEYALNVYYEDESDVELGARCENCGFIGFFMRGKLVPMVPA